MKYNDVIDEAKEEIREERLQLAKEEIKERLREIDLAESTLKEMRAQLEGMLDDDIR